MLVKLEGLDFFAHHGVYEEEREIGNKYTVSVELEISDEADYMSDQLINTIDYEEVYQLVKRVMDEPRKLLETLAVDINQRSLKKFILAKSIKTTVSKHNPPIKGVCHKATIVHAMSRS
ncbi:dihydroneopterin aldolase [Reichenbachiella versicolor]|uniref:dihydroneopterin aldolase n=1 Tax=Reichenbachiella versicolor TaxID=1821036 RepID=UPI000D6E620D|nr:dihydroneopterin aldolase [Reichenbachiella versicolor]